MLLGAGAGSIYGLKVSQFSLRPGARETYQNASFVNKFFSEDWMITAIPLVLAATSLALVDSMHLFAPLPLILSFGFVFTSGYFLGQKYQVPLWLLK